MAKHDSAGLKILREQIKEKKIGNVYLIYGDEDFLKHYYSDTIKKLIVEPDMEEFNYTVFEGEKQDLDDSPIGVDNADNGGENEKEDNDESDDDIIIPGYLDDPEEGSQIPRNEDYENDPIENPFGLDFNG